MVQLKDTYPLYLNNKAVQPNTDLEVTDNEGRILYHVDTDSLDARIAPLDGAGSIRIDIGRIGLLDGEFPINLKLIERSTGRVLDWKERSCW